MEYTISFKIILCVGLVTGNQYGRFEGDFCTILSSGANGQCKLFSKCAAAYVALQELNVYPETCGYKDLEPIVCCATDVVVPEKSNNNLIDHIVASRFSETKPPAALQAAVQISNRYKEDANYGLHTKPVTLTHLVLIGFDENGKTHWDCGGSIISRNFVLSSAHCAYHELYGSAKYILLGEQVLDTSSHDSMSTQITIKNIIAHPNYYPPSKYNDIALFQLDSDVDFRYAKIACLDGVFTSPATSLGITSLRSRTSTSGEETKHLQELTAAIISNSECNRVYGQRMDPTLTNGIMDAIQVCAGIRNQSKNICEKDFGGPLQIKNVEDRVCSYTITGATSFWKTCVMKNIPIVYTRVSAYSNWIKDIVWP